MPTKGRPIFERTKADIIFDAVWLYGMGGALAVTTVAILVLAIFACRIG